MNNLITINKTQMPVVEYQGQRVVTFSMIDLVHARPEEQLVPLLIVTVNTLLKAWIFMN